MGVSYPMKLCRNVDAFIRIDTRIIGWGDFLKELDLTEGRCTGIPTMQEELAKNGSPWAFVETDED